MTEALCGIHAAEDRSLHVQLICCLQHLEPVNQEHQMQKQQLQILYCSVLCTVDS